MKNMSTRQAANIWNERAAKILPLLDVFAPKLQGEKYQQAFRIWIELTHRILIISGITPPKKGESEFHKSLRGIMKYY